MRRRGVLLLIVLACVAAATPASAHSKSYSTDIEITDIAPGSVTGAIESSNEECVAGRTIKVLDGKDVVGTTVADEAGEWQVDAAIAGGATVTAKADKLFLKDNNKHKHICAPATSSVRVVPFQLTVQVTGDGSVISDPGGINCTAATSPCTASYDAATSTALEATPANGASFTNWGGACASAATQTCDLVVDANKSVTATFTHVPPPVTRVLEVAVSGPGSVTGLGINCSSDGGDCVEDYPIHQVVTLTATADNLLSSFDGWSESCTGTASTCQLTMNTDRAVGATFSSLLPEPLNGLLGQVLDAIAGLLGGG